MARPKILMKEKVLCLARFLNAVVKKFENIKYHFFYSDLRLFTGLAKAARAAWKLIVARAMKAARRPATPKTHHCMVMRYAKFWSQLYMIHAATIQAMMAAMETSIRNSRERR